MTDTAFSDFDPGELTLAEVEVIEAELDMDLQAALGDGRKRTRAIAAIGAGNRRQRGVPTTTDEVMQTTRMKDLNAAAEKAQAGFGVDPTAGGNGARPSPSPATTG